MEALEPATIAQNTYMPATMVGSSQTVCVLTDVQTSFDCGVFLKMTRGSPSIQKVQLITTSTQELYLHVLYTQLLDNFTPCKDSGVCTGSDIEMSDGTCNFLIRKLSISDFNEPATNAVLKMDDVRSRNALYQSIKQIYESFEWSSKCFQVSARLSKRQIALIA